MMLHSIVNERTGEKFVSIDDLILYLYDAINEYRKTGNDKDKVTADTLEIVLKYFQSISENRD